MSYQPMPPNGQAASGDSLPVVIASDQSPVPVTTAITAPGGSPESPLWVGSASGSTNRVSVEGGAIDMIGGVVAVQGTVTALLPADQLAALRAVPMPLDQYGRILVALPDAGPIIPPDVNLVTLTDPVVARPEVSTSNYQTALTVSTTAIRIAPANASRKCLLITNNSTGTLYIGNTQFVASSGVSMGTAVPAACSYSDSGFGVYLGELWGIYSASASSPNIAVSDRS